MKMYLIQTRCGDETFSNVMNEKKLADLYEDDQICGYLDEIIAFDLSDFGNPLRVDVYNVVQPILENKRWMEQEYRDYCDAVNEYGLDFEGVDLYENY